MRGLARTAAAGGRLRTGDDDRQANDNAPFGGSPCPTLESMTPVDSIARIGRARVSRADDVANLKGRIAEAFVEAIFRRAGFVVSRTGRESQFHRLVKQGGDEFLPDFLVRKPVGRPDGQRPLHQLVPVEVKYRRDLAAFLRGEVGALVERLAPHWPDLCIVVVTDRPDEGRSCFQALDLRNGDRVHTVDLHEVDDLDIYHTTVQEYDALAKQVFVLLEWHTRTRRAPVAAHTPVARL